MGKFVLKILTYVVFLFLFLEAVVRVFHLYRDTPKRIIDDRQVEKWAPYQTGYSVTGNRRQNFSAYRINNKGYNSYRDFMPSLDSIEIALIGDSFIQGFHQNFDSSIGKKLEERLPEVHVYEYGYAGYDLADELYLLEAYKEDFELIDYVVVYLKYPDDLLRNTYKVQDERIRLESGVFRILKKSKFLVYLQNIGLLGVPREALGNVKDFIVPQEKDATSTKSALIDVDEKYLNNFKSLVSNYSFNREKMVFLLDARDFPFDFLGYLSTNKFHYIDYGWYLEQSREPVTLIYDQHWNDLGRTHVAHAIEKWYLDFHKDALEDGL